MRDIQYQSNFSKPVSLEVLQSFGPSSNVPKLVSEMRREMMRQRSSGVEPTADANHARMTAHALRNSRLV